MEKLYVDKTFAMVHKGEPLAEIYSPELYSTAQELLLAAKRRPAADLAASARKRAGAAGRQPAGDRRASSASGQASPRLVIRSPQTGYVIDKKIVVGSSVEAGHDAPGGGRPVGGLGRGRRVREGHRLSAAGPEDRGHGRGAAQPHVHAASWPWSIRDWTRPRGPTASASSWTTRSTSCGPACSPRCGSTRRWRASSRSRAWRREAAAAADARAGLERRQAPPPRYEFLAVPERAVIDTGTKKVVYVEREPGLFEGVEVELGPRDRRRTIR